MKVIIGAGPAGLYTAIKLKMAGVNDVVVYDPRAGHYNRPGHLNQNAFHHAENGLNIKFWSNKDGHIKDLERALFKEAQRLDIKIENKLFIRLHQDKIASGVVVQHHDVEELIAADFVFDCTGGSRRVVASVNSICPESPLQAVTITEVPVSNHVLAYVKISNADWDIFTWTYTKILNDDLDHIDPIAYAKSIIKLKALGWDQLKFPRCYGKNFGKNKICLYFHAPDNLSQEHYDLWIQAVLEVYVPGMSYQHLPHPTKPRFLSFTVKAEALQQVSYKGKNLPTVIALGDAQIDFDYFLAHGILDGMKRIDALFEHMDIFDGKIYYFDAQDYYLALNHLFKEHKTAVINAADKLRNQFNRALEYGHIKFTWAIKHTFNAMDCYAMKEVIKEIEARQNYKHVLPQFMQLHDATHKIILAESDISDVFAKLNDLQISLLSVLHGLPLSFQKEREKMQELLQYLAMSWKEIGNALFKNKQIPESVQAYQKAIDIYTLKEFAGKNSSKEQIIYSNMTLAHVTQKNYSAAISAGKMGLLSGIQGDEPNKQKIIRQKIVFHLMKALCAHAEEQLLLDNHSEAHSLHQQAQSIVAANQLIFSRPGNQSLLVQLNELQERLIESQLHQNIVIKQSLAQDNTFALPAENSEQGVEKGLLQALGLFSLEQRNKTNLIDTPVTSCTIV